MRIFGLRQVEFARLLDVSPRTVSLWATRASEVPGPVLAYLRVLNAAGPAVLSQELRSLARRSKMLDEGLYNLRYRGEDRGTFDGGEALVVLRNGKILGTDHGGGMFSGFYEFDAMREKNCIRARLSIPPEGTLVTGFSAGPDGAALDVEGLCERAGHVSSMTVEAAGLRIEIQLTYLAPLPV